MGTPSFLVHYNWIAIGYTGIIFCTLGLDFDFDQNSDLCTAGFRLAFMGISDLSLRFSATCPLTRQADSFVLRRGRLGNLWVIYRTIYNPKQGAEQVWFTTILNRMLYFSIQIFFGGCRQKGCKLEATRGMFQDTQMVGWTERDGEWWGWVMPHLLFHFSILMWWRSFDFRISFHGDFRKLLVAKPPRQGPLSPRQNPSGAVEGEAPRKDLRQGRRDWGAGTVTVTENTFFYR